MLELLDPGNAALNVAGGLHLAGEPDKVALETALNEVVQEHEILRTGFRPVEGAPVQVVISSARATVYSVDLRHLARPECETQFVALAQQEAGNPFKLANGPLLRATLFQLSDTESAIVLVAHRIVCDEASVNILLHELYSRYEAQLNGESLQQEGIRLQYADFASLQTVPAADISWWTQRLAGAPSSLDLPTFRPRPPLQTFRGARQQICIDAPLLEQLRKVGQNREATLFSTLLAVFNILLSRYSRLEDVVVGTRVSGRGRSELENLIGPLENVLALRTDLSGGPSFNELLTRVVDAVEQAFSHQNVPFETLLREVRLERDLSRNPLFQIMFTLRDATATREHGPGVNLLEVKNPMELFDLSVEFSEEKNELKGTFSYNSDLFDAPTITRMMGHFRTLLESAAANPGIQISRMPLLSEAERLQLLVDWNDTRVSYPRNIPLHVLIEEQVEKTPDSLAVVYESERLTYRQLNDRANQLAHHLRRRGVGPDVLVAVSAERSLELVIALLSILKAGGAYTPFDPGYPKDRLGTMLRDANPPVVLAQAHLLDRLPEGTGGVFCLDRDWPLLRSESTENLPSTVGGKNLAYAIYTSGSTGKPKGVPNVHEGIVNRLLWMQDKYKLTGKDRVLQKTPFSFDVSVWEFFWALMTGASLVLARPGGHRDPAYLVNLIAEQGITTLHFVPHAQHFPGICWA